MYIIYINKRAYSTATLYPNCKAIGELLSEIFDWEQTDSYIFIYIDDGGYTKMIACLAEELFTRTDRTYARSVDMAKGIKIGLLIVGSDTV
jgi:hypothetical protein